MRHAGDWGRFEVVCPRDGASLIAWSTVADGDVIRDRESCDPSFEEQLVGFEHDPRNKGQALVGQDKHWRYAVSCSSCSSRGVEPYEVRLTDKTVEDVVHPILQGLHSPRATWITDDINDLLRRAARAAK